MTSKIMQIRLRRPLSKIKILSQNVKKNFKKCKCGWDFPTFPLILSAFTDYRLARILNLPVLLWLFFVCVPDTIRLSSPTDTWESKSSNPSGSSEAMLQLWLRKLVPVISNLLLPHTGSPHWQDNKKAAIRLQFFFNKQKTRKGLNRPNVLLEPNPEFFLLWENAKHA